MHTFASHGRSKRLLAWVGALLLTLSYAFSALIYQSSNVFAAEVSSRSIAMASTVENAETSYTFTFTVPNTGAENIGSFRVEFCDNSPLPGTTCTFNAFGDDIPQVDDDAGSIATLGSGTFDDTGGTDECSSVSLEAPVDADHYLDFSCNTADDITGAGNFTATVNFIDNPSNATDSPTNPNNTFYARLYVYSATSPTAIANPVTGYIHSGGVALSTAEQITVTARVQEVLHFCVGTTDAASADDCTDISGNTVDLGVVESGAVSISPVVAGNGGNNTNGLAMVRTNANSGVVVNYFAQQAGSGTNHLGTLRVTGASCNAGDVQTDQCFFTDPVQSAIVAGTEEFGMTSQLDTTNGSTTNLSRDGNYDGDGTAGGGWAWDESGTADLIASSSTVVDDEMIVLRFAATAAITTPTGSYSVVSTYIATPTF